MSPDASGRFVVECVNGHSIGQGARRKGEMERKVICPQCDERVVIDFRRNDPSQA